MRKAAWVLACLLSAGVASGCFVLEELDEAKRLSSQGGAARSEPAREEGTAESARSQGPGALARLQAWWIRFRTPPPPPPHPDDVAVRCRLGGQLLFTHKRDCLARGGVVESELAGR